MVEINVRDIGPIEEFAYEMRSPGLHVVKGMQGAGKTTILRTVQLAVDGRSDIRPVKRDGSPRGEANIGGKTLRIVKQIREEGELTSGIEGAGDLSIADMHSPNFKDAATRDRHRIKTLVRLAGVRADATLFHRLIGDREAFDAIVPFDSLRTDDLVEMAQRVKRAIEREAKRVEERRDTALADARSNAAIAETVDESTQHDEGVLQTALESAIRVHSSEVEKLDTMKAAQESAKQHADRVAAARAKLDYLGSVAVSVTEAAARVDRLSDDVIGKERTVERLEAQLSEARARLQAANEAKGHALDTLARSQSDEKTHRDLHEIINSSTVAVPDCEEIDAQVSRVSEASRKVELAKRAVTEGVKIREGIKARARSEQFQEAAKKLSEHARRLRNAATDTATILTDAIAKLNGCPIKILMTDEGDPRLVLETDRSDREPFDELSDGERWVHVVQIAAKANRLLVLPQSAFGELSPSSRQRLHDLALENDCYILTAVADDCELHGESYESFSSKAAE